MPNPVREKYASPISLYETTNVQQHKLGTRVELTDRVFRYAKFMDASTAVPANQLVQMAVPVANHVTQTDTAFAPISGDKSVTVTLGATLAQENQYQDGYLKLQSSTLGIGQIFKLRGHNYVASAGSLTAKLYDPVKTTSSGTEIYSLIHNPYSGVILTLAAALSAPCAGVATAAFAACSTASVATPGYLQTDTTTWTQPRFGWLQTWGISSILFDLDTNVNAVAGHGVGISQSVAGACNCYVHDVIEQVIGVSMGAMATDSIYLSVFLQIAP